MIYLDNAATTLQKPQAVARAMYESLGKCGSSGRGGHQASMNAARVILECRDEAARLFEVDNPERIIFTLNATHALNIAIKSVLKDGGTAVVSGLEHNAVMRPLNRLAGRGVRTRIAFTPLFEPEMAVHSFEQFTIGDAACIICTHVSNVFGYILPIERIDEICAARNIPLIIDAAQSAGCLPLNVSKLKSRAYVCMPGHKGLLGPQGTGILICPENEVPSTIIEGGTGSGSAEACMPDFLPDRLEPGTHNTPGIAGLLEGVRFIRERGTASVSEHCKQLTQMMAEELSGDRKIRIFSSPHMYCQSGVLSVTVRDKDPELIAARLAEYGIATRAGLHCAPMAHRTAGTFPTGTVRFSTSVFTTRGEVRAAVRALKKIAKL
ncbi:cysteine desulfurase [Clostridia bacterium]|nr:cysteine desulfurase [Clostridia bacterium]